MIFYLYLIKVIYIFVNLQMIFTYIFVINFINFNIFVYNIYIFLDIIMIVIIQLNLLKINELLIYKVYSLFLLYL